MELESVFSESKWRILSELANRALSPTEIAEKTKTSLANISTQLRLLEALDFIECETLGNVGKGEPRKLYRLKKEFAYMIIATNIVVGKKLFKIDEESMPYFAAWMTNDSNAPYVLMRFFGENEKLMKDAVSVSYLGIRGDELELLIIHQNPNEISYLNEKQIQRDGKNYKIKPHIHSRETFENGLRNREEYFLTILRKAFILSDKNNFLSKLKKGGK